MDIERMQSSKPVRRTVLIALAVGLALLAVVVPLMGLQSQGVEAGTIGVGFITDTAGLDDEGFNEFSYQGLLRAESELSVTGTVYTSITIADLATNLEQCVMDGNELCVSVGFESREAIMNAAQTYPNTQFAIVDIEFESYPGNLRGMIFDSQQAGYLAGTLAGLMTESNIIGDIGGMEILPVTVWTESYQKGAVCANPGVTTLLAYTNDFGNPKLGAATAQEMIAQGADVIFGAAGRTSMGAVLTATQSSVWAIGVDTDFYDSVFAGGAVEGSEYLLTSAMKHMDNAVFQTISDVVSGTFTSGTVVYDLSVDGVGLAPFHDADPFVPQSVRGRLEEVKQGIIDGTIDVNATCPVHPVYLPAVLKNDGG